MLHSRHFKQTAPAPPATSAPVGHTSTAQPQQHTIPAQPLHVPPKSDSIRAPYVKLTPIEDSDKTEIGINQSDQTHVPQYQTSEKVEDHRVVYYARLWDPCVTARSLKQHSFVLNVIMQQENQFKRDQYQVQGYSVRQDFLYHTYFLLLAIFLTWGGFSTQYASNVVRTSLLEHFSLDPIRLHIASWALKAGNNHLAAMTPHFQWLSRLNNKGNVLIFVNTHLDRDTGNLIVSGNAKNPESVLIHELLANYLGLSNMRPTMEAIAAINKSMGAGPYICGLVICCCGLMGRLATSANVLKHLVKQDVFYFILTFAGMSTIDIIVVSALNHFIKNVYIFNIEIWNVMEKSFGEDRHALNQTPVFISFVMMQNGPQGKCQCIVDTRVFAYNNLKDGQGA
ncbi:hypothetical protein BD769DRAFT_1390945 [Suillus cothurnatus]|nr:hypothetical protein BD769DRAFT_1390945 [Suillus cothurnatus]